MTKADLIERVAAKQGGSVSKRTLERILDDVFDEIALGLRRTPKLAYPGFGTFVRRRRKARRGWDPHAGQKIVVPAAVTVGFRPAKRLRDLVSGRL
jgi:DNA-binding protein HU-beta